MKDIKAQGLPVNLVVTLIIGIIIFGLGFAMFSKISNSGEKQIDDLNGQIRSDLAELECDGEDWVCTANHIISSGDVEDFSIYVTNHKDTAQEYTIEFKNSSNYKSTITSSNCGSIDILYPSVSFKIKSGEGAKIPFRVSANKVSKRECSFITTAYLKEDPNNPDFNEKTSVIIRIR